VTVFPAVLVIPIDWLTRIVLARVTVL
jgi:hypothetical protein